MLEKQKFYINQSVSNLKRSVLLILGLALAVSMLAGINYYFDAYEHQTMSASFDSCFDFEIVNYDNYDGNYSDFFEDDLNDVLDSIENAKVDYDSYYKSAYFRTSSIEIMRNFTEYPDLLLQGHEEIEQMDFNLANFDNSFYTSKRFGEYFAIYDGNYPQHEDEIMLDIFAAQRFNYSVGETVNLTLRYYSGGHNFYNISDIKIAGIYYAKNYDYEIRNDYFHIRYDPDEISSFNALEDQRNYYYFPDSLIFSYQNFSEFEDNHFIQIFNAYLYEEYGTNSAPYHHLDAMLGIAYDRDSISMDKLISLSTQLDQKVDIIYGSLPDSTYYINAPLATELRWIYESSKSQRTAAQFTIAPIAIFAIIIGGFAAKSGLELRSKEFLLLRSKGIPKKMIQSQILTEAVINGVVASLIGAIIGIPMFKLNGLWLDDLILYEEIGETLVYHFQLDTILNLFAFGVGISLISNIVCLKYIKKLKFEDLLHEMGANEYEIEYDEHTLFNMSDFGDDTEVYGDKQQISRMLDYHKNNTPLGKSIFKKKTKNSSNRSVAEITGNKSSEQIYNNLIKDAKNKISKKGIIFVIISLFPLIFYGIGMWSLSPNAPDSLLNFMDTFSEFFYIISILDAVTPILLSIGIYRIIVKESPSKFAKISEFLSRPFLKTKSYLIGLEMVKRKRLHSIILILTIFISLVTFINLSFNTMMRHEYIVDNFEIGADIKATFTTTPQITNESQLAEFEEEIKQISYNGETFVNDVLSAYVSEDSYNDRYTYFLDFEQYLDMLTEGDKYSSKLTLSHIEAVIEHDKDPNNSNYGAIVNEWVLTYNNLKLGDSIDINHTYYDSISDSEKFEIITVDIVTMMEGVPGLYYGGYWGNEFIALSSNALNQSQSLLHSENILQFIDIDYPEDLNSTQVQELIENATNDTVSYSNMYFYNQDWDNPDITSVEGSQGFYGLMYIEFVMLGALLAFGLALIMTSLQKENQYLFGTLLSRGFGKRNILYYTISQLFIVFLLSIIMGILSGMVTGYIFLSLLGMTYVSYGVTMTMPIYWDILNEIGIIGMIIGVCILIYFISHWIQSRKSISQYMRRF